MRLRKIANKNAKNGFYTHPFRLTQHPIDTMLQFDAKADADANCEWTFTHIFKHVLH